MIQQYIFISVVKNTNIFQVEFRERVKIMMNVFFKRKKNPGLRVLMLVLGGWVGGCFNRQK